MFMPLVPMLCCVKQREEVRGKGASGGGATASRRFSASSVQGEGERRVEGEGRVRAADRRFWTFS